MMRASDLMPRNVVAALTAALAISACSSGESIGPGTVAPTPPAGPVASFQPGLTAPWFGGSARSDWFEVGLDRGIRRGGNAAAYLRSRVTTVDGSAFANVAQSISAMPYRGRRVRLSAYVKTDSVGAPGAGLWMRVDGPTGTLRFDNMTGFGRAILGTRDWTEYSVVLDVPTNAVGITMGALLIGSGTMRVDDVSFGTVDIGIPTTGTAQPGTQTGDSATTTNNALRAPSTPTNLDFEGVRSAASSAATWLASVAKPFATDAPGANLDDLAELGSIIGTARVAAFGEATHGTREFFRMKHRAFEYLVERHGFTHFTIEATMPESRAMDRFVTHGEGDPEKLLSNLYFWTWNTQEVMDLVRWMRAYNVRVGAPRLRFVGFDMQAPHQAVDSVLSLLNRLDVPLAARARNAMECFVAGRDARTGQYVSSAYRAGTTAAQRVACGDSLTALGNAVAAARPQWSARMSAEDLDWLQQYVTLVQQWERYARPTSSSEGSLLRDVAMADNLVWITRQYPSARVFAWAHNYHVSRRPGTMGQVAGQRLGADYRNIGFTFGTGDFNAVGLTATGTTTSLRSHSITTVDTTALEAVFAATLQPRLIFDARRIPSGGSGAAALNAGPLRMRSIGAAYTSASESAYFEQALLPADYDGLIWFARTTPSVLLPFR
jgi:erythromycin esterase